MKKLIMIIAFIVIFQFGLHAQENVILNPFKREYGSILDYNRFKTLNQISFTSFSSKNYSGSYGIYLNTLQYSINPHMDAYAHLGKKFDFNKKESAFNFQEKQDYLSGGTFVYKIKPDFKIGLEYGDTPSTINSFNIYPTPFNIDKNAKFWLNKNFGKTELDIYINYLEVKPAEH